MQRALLQWRRPDKRAIVIQALKQADREDLIGYGKECLIHPRTNEHFAHLHPSKPQKAKQQRNQKNTRQNAKNTRPDARRTSKPAHKGTKAGWAKPKKKR